MRRGQALVEFALVFPVLCFAFVGMGEAAFLFSAQHGYQSEADVLAQWAADHPADVISADQAWSGVVASESTRTGCDGTPAVTWPDGTQIAGSRVALALTCHYQPHITSNLWTGLPVGVAAEAVVQ